MTTICASSPIPTYNTIRASLGGAFSTVPDRLVFPDLPTLPSNLFSLQSPLQLRAPSVQLAMLASEIQTAQFLLTATGFLYPVVAFFGGQISSFLPPLPGFQDATIVDLITPDPSKFVAEIKQGILSAGSGFAGSLGLPFLTAPVFPTISSPDFEANMIFQNLVKGYLLTVANVIISAIEQVRNFIENRFEINLLPLPPIPTMPSVDTVFRAIGGSTNIEDAVRLLQKTDFNVSQAISGLTVPGVPTLRLPDPLFPTISCPELELQMGVNLLISQVTFAQFNIINTFVESVLTRFIRFDFPLFCADIT